MVPPELECPWSKVDKMVVRRQVKYGSDRPKVHHRVYVIGWLLALIHHRLRNQGLRNRPPPRSRRHSVWVAGPNWTITDVLIERSGFSKKKLIERSEEERRQVLKKL